MFFSLYGSIYQILIDPVLSRLYPYILSNINQSDKVIDVACGTGSLSLTISESGSYVTGIDISESMIETARKSAKKRNIKNVRFSVLDASDLSQFRNREFDVAVITMAVHQFDKEQAIKILGQMKRIAAKVIIMDYNYPIPANLPGAIASGIERIVGGEHYRNFRVYNKYNGMGYFLKRAGLVVRSQVVSGNQLFIISECE